WGRAGNCGSDAADSARTSPTATCAAASQVGLRARELQYRPSRLATLERSGTTPRLIHSPLWGQRGIPLSNRVTDFPFLPSPLGGRTPARGAKSARERYFRQTAGRLVGDAVTCNDS